MARVVSKSARARMVARGMLDALLDIVAAGV